MSDRKLLEDAARAAGMVLDELDGRVVRRESDGQPVYWNPLTSVADATRLLLALRLRVDYVGDQPCIAGVLQSGMTAEEAFCRAIVRAAAAMAPTPAEREA